MLLIVAHPAVGAGLETLLHLDQRLEVRRVAHFSDAAPVLGSWRPDLALVDGVLLQDGERRALGVPSLVLSGAAVDAAGLRPRLDDARGWLRKDATPEELGAAIDRVLQSTPVGGRARQAALVATMAAIGVAIFLAWGFLALRPPG